MQNNIQYLCNKLQSAFYWKCMGDEKKGEMWKEISGKVIV